MMPEACRSEPRTLRHGGSVRCAAPQATSTSTRRNPGRCAATLFRQSDGTRSAPPRLCTPSWPRRRPTSIVSMRSPNSSTSDRVMSDRPFPESSRNVPLSHRRSHAWTPTPRPARPTPSPATSTPSAPCRPPTADSPTRRPGPGDPPRLDRPTTTSSNPSTGPRRVDTHLRQDLTDRDVVTLPKADTDMAGATADAAPHAWRSLVTQTPRAYTTPGTPLPSLPAPPTPTALYRAMVPSGRSRRTHP